MTSRRPNASTAACTADLAASSSATSTEAVRIRSPYFFTRSSRRWGSRAVATRRASDARTASAMLRPKPLALPVTSHTFDIKASYKSACLLSRRLLSPLLVSREVGRRSNISLRFESGKAIRQRLVDRVIGVAAEGDPLRRRILIDAVDDDFHHLGGIAWRKARRVFDHSVDHGGRGALVGFDLRAKLRPAKAEMRAGAARLYDRNADLERREFLGDRIQKTLQSPLARVVKGAARKRCLAAIRGQAD